MIHVSLFFINHFYRVRTLCYVYVKVFRWVHIAFYTLTHVLKYIPLSITYATWSGVGLVATALISVLIFQEGYSVYTVIGIVLTVIGIVILNLFGNAGH